MPNVVWRSMLVCLACAGAQVLGAQDNVAANDQPLDAMLLAPVDGRIALWVNQPANFAVVGVAPEHGAAILYQQTALEGVPQSGYIYAPQGDAGYDRVYLVASKQPLDLSGTLDNAMSSASVLDAYATDTILDRLRCADGRLYLALTEIDKKTREIQRIVAEEDKGRCDVPYRDGRLTRPYLFAAGRGFFFPTRPTPTHKSLPPGFKPPKVEPKPSDGLPPASEHALRWLAAKDEWHAVTHNGEPGTELATALGYTRVNGQWGLGPAMSPLLDTKREQVRSITSYSGGSSSRSNAPASISTVSHESTNHTSYSAPSAPISVSLPGGHH